VVSPNGLDQVRLDPLYFIQPGCDRLRDADSLVNELWETYDRIGATRGLPQVVFPRLQTIKRCGNGFWVDPISGKEIVHSSRVNLRKFNHELLEIFGRVFA